MKTDVTPPKRPENRRYAPKTTRNRRYTPKATRIACSLLIARDFHQTTFQSKVSGHEIKDLCQQCTIFALVTQHNEGVPTQAYISVYSTANMFSRKRLEAAAVFGVCSLLVLLPMVTEYKSLSPLLWNLEQHERDGNITASPTASPISADIALGLANESPSNLDSQHSQIDVYFEALPPIDPEISWIRKYLHWHANLRAQYPDTQLIDDANGPKLMIVYLDPKNQGGGLTDRMKSLGHLLQICHKEERLMLLKWYDAPHSLESFLVPHLLNFTVPSHNKTDYPEKLIESFGGSEGRIKIQKFVNQLGQYLNPYGVIWHAIFRPSPTVQDSLSETMSSLGLSEGRFDVVHCRLGHPAYRDKTSYDSKTDKDKGYNFAGVNRVRAISTAMKGIRCSKKLALEHIDSSKGKDSENTSVPIYFYADSAELVKTIVEPSSLKPGDDSQKAVLEELKTLASATKIVGRTEVKVAHLDRRSNNTSLDAFVSTFVDLYVASKARCVSMGVGRFAYMAAKISGTTCWIRHQVPSSSVGARWGMTIMSREVPKCRL